MVREKLGPAQSKPGRKAIDREEPAVPSKPYDPANVAAQPFPAWRVIALAWAGKALGIQFKIDGIPYGAPYRRELWPASDECSDGVSTAF